MNNTFKKNTRFSSLIDDVPVDTRKEQKSNKVYAGASKEETVNYFKSPPANHNKNREPVQEKQVVLNINDFPSLSDVVKDTKNIKNKCSYANKLKNEKQSVEPDTNEIKPVDPDLAKIEVGWSLLKRDPITRKTLIINHPENNQDETLDKNDGNNSRVTGKSEKQIANEIMNSLIDLHVKRREEYIELNGYEMWEKIFKFPNWQEDEMYYDSDSDEDEEDEYENEDYEYYEEDDFY